MTIDRVQMLKQILEQNANDTFARYGLALEYANSGQVDAAMSEFHKLLEVHPDYVPGYQMAAQTLLAAGQPVLPSDALHSVGIPEYLPLAQQGIYFTAQYPTCTSPCQPFDAAPTSSSA